MMHFYNSKAVIVYRNLVFLIGFFGFIGQTQTRINGFLRPLLGFYLRIIFSPIKLHTTNNKRYLSLEAAKLLLLLQEGPRQIKLQEHMPTSTSLRWWRLLLLFSATTTAFLHQRVVVASQGGRQSGRPAEQQAPPSSASCRPRRSCCRRRRRRRAGARRLAAGESVQPAKATAGRRRGGGGGVDGAGEQRGGVGLPGTEAGDEHDRRPLAHLERREGALPLGRGQRAAELAAAGRRPGDGGVAAGEDGPCRFCGAFVGQPITHKFDHSYVRDALRSTPTASRVCLANPAERAVLPLPVSSACIADKLTMFDELRVLPTSLVRYQLIV